MMRLGSMMWRYNFRNANPECYNLNNVHFVKLINFITLPAITILIKYGAT